MTALARLLELAGQLPDMDPDQHGFDYFELSAVGEQMTLLLELAAAVSALKPELGWIVRAANIRRYYQRAMAKRDGLAVAIARDQIVRLFDDPDPAPEQGQEGERE